MFTKAIVRPPAKSLVNGISSANLGSPDYNLAITQHKAYVAALEKCGLTVDQLPVLEDYPDSVFVEDIALITPYFAVVTNPGADERKGEIEGIETFLSKYISTIEKIEAPGTLDGGDVMMVGDHFFIGLSERTNLNGAFQLISILKKHMMTGSTLNIGDMLHLKTGLAYVEQGNLIAVNPIAQHPTFEEFNVLEIPIEEAYAANCIWVNDKVIIAAGYPKIKIAIEQLGYETIEVDMSEYKKLDGGLSCLSLRF